MLIKNLEHYFQSEMKIRGVVVIDVKIAMGVVQEDNKIQKVKLKVFKYNKLRYCCIEQDGCDGRFIEVTPKFYDVIDQLNEKTLSGWNLENFKLQEL